MKGATTAAAAAVLAVVAAGCSDGAEATAPEATTPDASVCVKALDAADAGFRALGAQITTVQQALRQAFAGDLDAAQSTLDRVERVSPQRYKLLEQACRDAVHR